MKIATWNINSVRLRIDLLAKLVAEENPDVICLQETKVQNNAFPLKQITSLGYPHTIFSGQMSYNGVAILSKLPITGQTTVKIAGSDDCRHIATILPGDIELHNFYVPAGGDEPDTKINDKYRFKLDFVDDMQKFFRNNRSKNDKMIILGDFNIAPYDNDVWSHKQLINVVSHTEPEITRLNNLKEDFSWVDLGRHFVDEKQKLYSWWSYRNKDWQKSNRGRRLDHIWSTPCISQKMKNFKILQDVRSWTRPSDHVPVIVEVASV